jgi:DNA-directed RNA polymerase subunit RPC12/RpoP
MVTGQTRFFCRCGRLITVDGAASEIVCPTCKQKNVVPRNESFAARPPVPPPLPPLFVAPPFPAPAPAPVAPPLAAPAVAPIQGVATNGSATAILDVRVGGQLGRFELSRVLGHGGMGTVYQARDTVSGRDVALKILHPVLQGRPDFISRFQREARAAEP